MATLTYPVTVRSQLDAWLKPPVVVERKWLLMKALVVYESMFGNTEQIARAVAEGLGESVDVQVVEVAEAAADPDPDVALLVAGAPTHAFSMSRETTRGDAINKGAHEGEREFGLREWMAALPSGQHAEKMATFDTKIESMRHLPGSAAKGAAKAARRHGYQSAANAESFTSVISMVHSSTVKSIGPRRWDGSSPCRSPEQPMQPSNEDLGRQGTTNDVLRPRHRLGDGLDDHREPSSLGIVDRRRRHGRSEHSSGPSRFRHTYRGFATTDRGTAIRPWRD